MSSRVNATRHVRILQDWGLLEGCNQRVQVKAPKGGRQRDAPKNSVDECVVLDPGQQIIKQQLKFMTRWKL